MKENIKKIKRIAVDGDGTMWHFRNSIFGSSWDFFSDFCGVREKKDELMNKYYGKQGMWFQWVKEEALLYKGFSVEKFENKIKKIPYVCGIREFMQETYRKYERGLLTGGLLNVASRAADELKLEWYLANPLKIENGKFTGEHIGNVSLDGKRKILEDLFCNVPLDSVCYIGDSRNDVECMKISGLAIAVNPKDEETKLAADYAVNNFFEIMEILGLNGYKKSRVGGGK